MENKVFLKLEDCIDYAMKMLSNYAAEGVCNNIGGPFGAAVVLVENNNYKIVSVGRNSVISGKDPTCHAEINAIREACKILDRFELSDCVLITTAKSCPMCISASCWAKISKIYYALDYEYASTQGFKDAKILEHLQNKIVLLEEIKVDNDYAKIPFQVWENKEDRIDY